MNKKIITGLISLMGVSILGVIIIQLVWMNNAIKVKNELFDRSVDEALTNTTRRLENMQDLRLINHLAFNDTVFRGLRPPVPPPPGFRADPKALMIPRTPRNVAEHQMQMIVQAARNGNKIHYKIHSGKDTNNRLHVEDLVVVDADSLGRRLDSIYTKKLGSLDSIAIHNQFWVDSTSGIKHRLKMKTNHLKMVANKVVREITTWESNKIPMEQIQSALKTELENRNIPIRFELGILQDSLITEKTAAADSADLRRSVYKVNLFPNDIIQKNKLLAIYFPEKDTFIYQTLNWLLVLSLIFSIIVLVSFAASIYFILKQKKISEMKSDFINNMTHEFKTPIATIAVAADSVANPKVIENPEKIRYFIDMIKKENIRMNRQVEDILTIARLDKKDFEFKWETVDLHDVISGAIQSISLQVEKRGGKITTQLQAANSFATSDASHIANVIYNLLDNANKYSTGAPEIKIATRNNNKGVIITVEDRGIGMTKAAQSRIFERFYRQTSGNIHNVKGFGLGLSYVKAVIEANQGTVSVHSEPGKGSRFEVFIPFILN